MSQSHNKNKTHEAVLEFIRTSVKLRIKKKILDNFYGYTNIILPELEPPPLVKDINIIYYLKQADNLKTGECKTIFYNFPYWFYHIYKYNNKCYAIIEKSAKIIQIYDLTLPQLNLSFL